MLKTMGREHEIISLRRRSRRKRSAFRAGRFENMIEAGCRAFAGGGEFYSVVSRETPPLAERLGQIACGAANFKCARAVLKPRRDEIPPAPPSVRSKSGAAHREIRIVEGFDVYALRMVTARA